MAEKEIPEALSSLFEAVLAYQDTQEGLARVRSMAESVWGGEWREKLPGILADAPDEIKDKVKANIDRALTYEKAASVWADVARLLDPKRPVDATQVKAQLPEIQRWLSIFGKAGQDMVARLQAKVAETEAAGANAVVASSAGAVSNGSSTAANYGLTVEQLWNFEHFLRLKNYYDQTISRTSARCVHLGGLELSQYPYFGYILDLLDEILTFGMEIITPPYAAIVRDRYKGGDAALKKLLREFRKEFEDNAPPEMLAEDESLEDIKERLGNLADNSEPEEEIGPAPDGFEAPEEEPARQPQQGPQSQQPSAQQQPVRMPAGAMKKVPQKMPIKVPVQAKMPVKRPAPAG